MVAALIAMSMGGPAGSAQASGTTSAPTRSDQAATVAASAKQAGDRVDWSAGPVARWTGYSRRGGSLRVREVQRTLRRLDYRPGPIDGLYGPRTERAVVRFQRAEQLVTDGVVGAQTLDRLHERAGERRPVPKRGPRSSDRPSVAPGPGRSPAPAPAETAGPGRGGIVLGPLLGLLVALLVSAGAVAAVPGRSRKRSEAVAPAFEPRAGRARIVKPAGAERSGGRQTSGSLPGDAVAPERMGSSGEPPLCDDPTRAELLRCVYADFFEDQVARELREAPKPSSWSRLHPVSASPRDGAAAPVPPALE